MIAITAGTFACILALRGMNGVSRNLLGDVAKYGTDFSPSLVARWCSPDRREQATNTHTYMAGVICVDRESIARSNSPIPLVNRRKEREFLAAKPKSIRLLIGACASVSL